MSLLDLTAKKIMPEELKKFCIEAMLKCGMKKKDSRIAAEVLVTADTWGTFTHGTKQLRNLLKGLCMGGLDPKAVPEIVSEGPAWAIVDGHYAMPLVTGTMAMELAIKKAKSAGIAYVGVKHCSHFGAAGYYANMAVKEDMFGLSGSNADTIMTVPGAKGRVLGTNPLAYAVPAGKNRPVLLDIATSAVAYGKIFAAKQLGKKIPLNWMVDEDGTPTDDPNNLNKGFMLPMAGHKGYGLALMIEVLCGVLTGAAVTKEIKKWVEVYDQHVNQGHFFIAINVGAMIPIGHFKSRMDKLIEEIKGSPKAADADEIFLPGEIELKKRENALKYGIELPEDVIANLMEMAKELGLEVKTL